MTDSSSRRCCETFGFAHADVGEDALSTRVIHPNRVQDLLNVTVTGNLAPYSQRQSERSRQP